MGSGIAEVAAKAGSTVVLRSRKQETADAMVAGARQVAGQAGRARASSTRPRPRRSLGPGHGHHRPRGAADCDLVIESVVEDLDVKKQLFVELDRIVKDGAILATNTSTLPVVEMAVETEPPEQVVGIHFFNPAPMMSLVEIVRPLLTSDETVAEARRSPRPAARTPVEVKDRAGFIVNALLFPYLNNAVRMLENGTASRDDIDAAMKGGCNFPMGPLALLDLVGLDTSLAILDALYAEFRDPNYAAVPLLRRMVAAGHLGRKSGQGFYDYGSPSEPDRPGALGRWFRGAKTVDGPSWRGGRSPRSRRRRQPPRWRRSPRRPAGRAASRPLRAVAGRHRRRAPPACPCAIADAVGPPRADRRRAGPRSCGPAGRVSGGVAAATGGIITAQEVPSPGCCWCRSSWPPLTAWWSLPR